MFRDVSISVTQKTSINEGIMYDVAVEQSFNFL